MSESSQYLKQKGTHDSPRRRSINKKRKFSGNQHTFEQSTASTSMSADKLLKNKDEEIVIDPTHGYCILQFISVFSAISNLVMCKTCGKEITFNQASPRGLGFKIAVICECGVSYINSGPMISNAFEINRRLVSVMRLLGIGINGVNLFCSLMDLIRKFHIQTFNGCFANLWTAAESICKFSMQRAVEEEKKLTLEEEDSETNLAVFREGTWKKRGRTSRFGVVTLAGKYSKKIIDSCVKSTYCQSCVSWEEKKVDNPKDYEEWLSQHNDCDKNHEKSVSEMEVDSIKDMFRRSIDNYGVKYTRYIGVDDSVTYEGLLDCNPYDVPIQKLECQGNNTQNNNKSYNDLLWHFAPKHLHRGLKTIELSNYFATSIFNDGYYSILKMFNVMGIIVGPAASDYVADKDDTRLRIADDHQQATLKEGRSTRRKVSATLQMSSKEEEGTLYGPGIAD